MESAIAPPLPADHQPPTKSRDYPPARLPSYGAMSLATFASGGGDEVTSDRAR